MTHKHSARRRIYDDEEDDDVADAGEEYDFTASSGTLGQQLLGYDGALNVENAIGYSPHSSSAKEAAYLRHIQLEPTQSIWTFSVTQPGIIRIERVIDKSDNDVRIPAAAAESARILVVPCPSASLSSSSSSSPSPESNGPTNPIQAVCQGDDPSSSLNLSVDVYGYPPLKLNYHRILGGTGARDAQIIEGIAPEGAVLSPHSYLGSGNKNHKASLNPPALQNALIQTPPAGTAGRDMTIPTTVSVPLNISLATAGSHLYRLDKVTDACGNTFDINVMRERYSSMSSAQAERKDQASKAAAIGDRGDTGLKVSHSRAALTSRLQGISEARILVYPRAQVSFVGCGTGSVGGGGSSAGTGGRPVKLLRGQHTSLQLRVTSPASVSSNQGFADDVPWSVTVKFEPEAPDMAGTEEPGEKSVPAASEKEVVLKRRSDSLIVQEAGLYSISRFHSAHCMGDILEPTEVTSNPSNLQEANAELNLTLLVFGLYTSHAICGSLS